MHRKMIWALSIVSLSTTVACGKSKPAQSADDAADGATSSSAPSKSPAAQSLEPGAKVCVDTSLGNRRLVEDALVEGGFEPIDSCMVADAMVREEGEPGAYELKYQRVGDDEWASCTSDLDGEMAFLEQCVIEMGGQAPVASLE